MLHGIESKCAMSIGAVYEREYEIRVDLAPAVPTSIASKLL